MAVFNIDGIGVKTAEETAAGKKTNVTAYTKPEGKRLAELMGDVNARYSIGLQQRTAKRPRPGDDDGSFVLAGYPAAKGKLPIRWDGKDDLGRKALPGQYGWRAIVHNVRGVDDIKSLLNIYFFICKTFINSFYYATITHKHKRYQKW